MFLNIHIIAFAIILHFNEISAAHCRRGYFFFRGCLFLRCSRGLRRLKHQKNQKCFQQRGFFAARVFTLQSGQNHGLGKFAPLRRSIPALQQTFPMPSPPHSQPCSPRFRPKLSAD
jgi:hypothetical protein